ncbi:MAG: hypothetical protein A3F70_05760 [Acidobacteria bacterium RIFCSPLOWO2_12_FULL_67_14]|nr:MAG: hypothetical protein A3F70_05760 [Acidobacteria bacterium RIFCSPLOWO2_12_FULL_67_14]
MHADRVDLERHDGAVDGLNFAEAHHPECALDDRDRVVDDRARLAARDQRPVRLVGAVGKALTGGPQAGAPAGGHELGFRQAKQDEGRVDQPRRARDGVGQRRIARGHVEERPVRLDMLEPHALGGGHRGKRPYLIHHEVFDVAR